MLLVLLLTAIRRFSAAIFDVNDDGEKKWVEELWAGGGGVKKNGAFGDN